MKYPIAILAATGLATWFADRALADETLDQIVVTASRAPISAADVGSAVTIISRDEIEQRQARYVTDLLRAVPGFAVSHTGVAGSQTQVRVRGSEANHVLVLIDGIRANDPATGDEFRWEYLATANIERIEIVRGPQSALWGSDAIGGVVHIVTRSGAGGPGFGAYLEAGSANTLNGAFNGGFGDDDWSVAFGVEQLTTDGENIARTGDEKDDADIMTGTFNARFAPRESFAVHLGARVVDAYSQFDAVDFSVTGLPADSDVATDAKQAYAQLGASLGRPDQRDRHHVAVRYFGSDNRNLVGGLEDSSSASDRVTLAYQADVTLADHLLSLALEHEQTRFEQRGAVVFDDPNQDQQMDATSAVADLRMRAGEHATVLLSARFEDNSDFENSLTGRTSLAWRLGDATTLRANAGTGQKTPTFIERFGFFPGSFAGNPDLEPERSISYDVGLDHSFGPVVVNVNAFRQDLDNEINGFHCPDPWPAPCTAINMTGTSRRSGIEIGLRWAVGPDADITANYTYTDARDSDSAAELRRPRHAGSLRADVRFLDDRGSLTLTADYGGTRRDVFFPPWPNPSEIVSLPGYWLVDVTAQFRISEAVRLFARGSNLLDTDYEQVYGYRTAGRAVYGGVRVSFGR